MTQESDIPRPWLETVRLKLEVSGVGDIMGRELHFPRVWLTVRRTVGNQKPPDIHDPEALHLPQVALAAREDPIRRPDELRICM